ncbi:hypothetical protein [Phytohabitans suffuscus]|uniref:Gram-positive cocci surface proteins LPxTG domain-containing protein n=1 Tax=Phytohabitans suffuscus TaxID=624315 RepID=A0A6F8YXV6_9ACTN|nr:hypothetical protein [Phytohabitans suffuscus]BCB90896.1 hypothetical protein Psuf_082090 [Phytohabitans suffuscus]
MPIRGLASGLAVLACVAAAAGVVAPAPAAAHPFGDPQTVAISLDAARPEVVRVRWKVGGLDDLTVLGVALGVLPSDRVLLDGAVFYEDSDAAAVGPSPRFADYLRERITVTSDGRECAGAVAPPTDLARDGAAVDYACPGAVGVVDVAVRMLTDLDPAYQTLATGPGGARAVYTFDAYTHEWRLGDAVPAAGGGAGTGRGAALQIGAVVGALLLLAAAAAVLARRRRVAT